MKMQQHWLLLAALAVSWLVSCQAQVVEPALALGALALLKGAAIAGFKLGRGSSYGSYYSWRRPYYRQRRWGRAAGGDPRQVEDVLLTSVTQLDPEGCLLKLLCLARATPAVVRTPYQAALLQMFASIAQVSTPSGKPFVQALQAGGTAGKAEAACHSGYTSCPLSDDILHGMLVQAWGTADHGHA